MYQVGDRVRIVERWTGGCRENPYGKMDKWLGQIMTIRRVRYDTLCGCYTYKMDEDRSEYMAGWTWFPNAIAGLADQDYEEIDDSAFDAIICI